MALGFLLLPDARRHLWVYLSLFLAGALVSLLAARSLSGSGPGFLLLCGALFRATLLLRAPDLSEDVDRYVWDGVVARQGISPYRYAPDDPALDRLPRDLRARVAHREIRTVYPPAAQAVFRVFGGGGRVRPLKAFFAAADLSIVALLWSGAGPGGAFAAALYAFHPLPITEVAGQGHLDGLGVALLLACLLCARSNRRVACGVGFALSVMTKYVSLAAAIPIFRRARFAGTIAFVLAVGGLWLAAARGGSSPTGGLDQFAQRWDFNSALYPGAVRLMEATQMPERAKEIFIDWKSRLHDPPWTQRIFPFFYPAFFARALLGVLLGVALLTIGLCVRGLERSVFASLAALLLVSPTLHPWYLLWILPLAALLREPSFLYLSVAVPLSYGLLYPLAGIGSIWVWLVEYVPFAGLLAWTCLRSLADARRGTGRAS